MPLETATYISDLNATNPVGGTDFVSSLDDHIRLIKSTVKATFPSVAGAVSATDTELSYVHGVTSAIQTQLNAKAPLASPTFTGNPQAPTPATTDSSTTIPTTAMVQAAIAAAAMTGSTPTVPADANKVWTSTGSIGQWSNGLNATVMRWKDGTDTTKLLAWDCSGITTGTTRTVTVPNKSGTMAMTSDLVLTAAFLSTDQTITSGGALTLAHGLGSIPKIVQCFVKCATAENGYSIGDVLCMPAGQDGAGNANGVSVVPDATNLNIRFGSGGSAFGALNKTTGAQVLLTNANWTFHVRAFA